MTPFSQVEGPCFLQLQPWTRRESVPPKQQTAIQRGSFITSLRNKSLLPSILSCSHASTDARTHLSTHPTNRYTSRGLGPIFCSCIKAKIPTPSPTHCVTERNSCLLRLSKERAWSWPFKSMYCPNTNPWTFTINPDKRIITHDTSFALYTEEHRKKHHRCFIRRSKWPSKPSVCHISAC